MKKIVLNLLTLVSFTAFADPKIDCFFNETSYTLKAIHDYGNTAMVYVEAKDPSRDKYNLSNKVLVVRNKELINKLYTFSKNDEICTTSLELGKSSLKGTGLEYLETQDSGFANAGQWAILNGVSKILKN